MCKEIKATPEIKAIPVIFLTAKTLEHNVISGLEIGADDYITKPFSISVVIISNQNRFKAYQNKINRPNKSKTQPNVIGRNYIRYI